MSIFQNQISAIAEEIQYHKDQITIAEQELYSLKAAQEFVIVASAQVNDAIEHIDVKYLELFKEHLLTLFEGREQPSQVDTISNVNVKLVVEENTTTTLPTRVTGLPDCGAPTYIDIAPGVVYSSEGTCYMGFSDRPIAESYGRQLVDHEFTTGFIVEKPIIVNDAKWELRFHCNKDNANRLASLDLEQELTHPNNKSITDSWLLPVKPIATEETLVEKAVEVEELTENIYYSHTDQVAYLGFSNKQKARNYGDYLCGTHTVGSKYHVATNPKYCLDAKYELIIKDISLSHAEKLTKFNLKQDPPKFSYVKAEQEKDAFKELKRKPAPAVKPEEKPTPLTELEVADIVHRGRSHCLYEIEAVKRDDQGELYALCRCIQHSDFPSLVGETFTFKEVYIVEKASASVA